MQASSSPILRTRIWSITSAKIIESLKPIFSHPGEPYKLKTDDGPRFVSEELKAFLAEGGTEHRTTWSQAGKSNTDRTLLKVIQTEGKDWRQELHTDQPLR